MAAPQQAAMGQPPPDMTKVFKSEKEALDMIVHRWDLEGVEERVLSKLGGGSDVVVNSNEKKTQ